MEEVLAHCASRFDTLILTTEHPEYFAPFGFRVVREHVFTMRSDSAGGDGFRLLDPRQPDDVILLHRLLETRQPVSQVVGVVNDKAVFCFNEGSRQLHYAADLDVMACFELEGRRLKLFDIVCPAIPRLVYLLDRIRSVDEVVICFSPDQLGVDAEAGPHLFDHDGPSYLMVHGPFAAEDRTFTLPRSART